MNGQLSISVWRIGSQTQVSYIEYDTNHNQTFRVTYPLTYPEAADLGHWGTARIRKNQGNAFLNADGWCLVLPINEVISPDIEFHRLHSDNRRKPDANKRYSYLEEGYCKIVYGTD